MNKPFVIYHADCADGFGAAFAAWTQFGDNAEYLPMQYGKDYSLSENTFDFKAREIYILDFSFPRNIMDMLFAGAEHIVWLDHHRTAFEMWEVPTGQRVWAETEKHHVKLHMDKSGALLAWEYFHPGEEIPMLFKHIDDYDRWQFQLAGTKEIQQALWSYTPWSFAQWNQFLEDTGFQSDDSTGIDAWYREGAAILRAHNQQVASTVKNAAIKCSIQCDLPSQNSNHPIQGQVCIGLAANCPPHMQNDVGHQLAIQSGTYGLLWSINTAGACKCSLRSNGDYDVSAIAKAFGGGGHRNAAGFIIDIQTLLGWLKWAGAKTARKAKAKTLGLLEYGDDLAV